MKGKIIIDKNLCKGCELCIEFCPKKVIHITKEFSPKGYFIAEYKEKNEDGCSGCATCAVVCPEAAIEVYRE